MARWRPMLVTALLVAGWSDRSLAQPATSHEADVSRRLAWIERALAREQAATRAWHDGWLGFFAGASLAQVGLVAAARDPTARVIGLVGGAKAALGFGFLLVSPATGRTAADSLHALPDQTPTARLTKLRRGEALLRRVAAEERFRRSWFPLVGGALVNTAGAWIAWAATRRAGAGWFGLASGVAVTQVYLHSQPTFAMRAWDTYARAWRADLEIAPAPRWSLSPAGLGLSMQVSF